MSRVVVTGGSGFIGGHLIAHLLEKGMEVLNLDIAEPGRKVEGGKWRKCSILDYEGMLAAMKDFRPRFVVHLAACTAMDGKSLADYRENTEGTANLLKAVGGIFHVERVVVTSTQHVRMPGSGAPADDWDYNPYMLYGRSKAVTEELTRNAGLECIWTIIRPTAVWGPRHMLLANGLWRLMRKGWYFHPTEDRVIRNFGYVRNVVWQVGRILEVDAAMVNRRVLYVGDANMRQEEWIEGFARALSNRPVKRVPRSLLRTLAWGGDGLRFFGWNTPIHSSRYFNLTTMNPVPIERTLVALGQGPIGMYDGIRETAEWLEGYYAGRR